jgi:hypothetical protein
VSPLILRYHFPMFRAAILAAFLLSGCGDDMAGGDARLIPPGDGDYATLETPEAAGECAGDTDCEVSCVHSCRPVPTGPVTCPSDPPPEPERIMGAACLCVDSVCAYY